MSSGLWRITSECFCRGASGLQWESMFKRGNKWHVPGMSLGVFRQAVCRAVFVMRSIYNCYCLGQDIARLVHRPWSLVAKLTDSTARTGKK